MARLSKSTQPKTTAHLTAHVPIDLDTAVSVEAAKRRINKTDVIVEALTNYFKLKERSA
jgi:hypothetical protein